MTNWWRGMTRRKNSLDALKQDKPERTARKEKICRFLKILR